MSGELPAVSRDKGRLQMPRVHFPLSSAASLLTWSQSEGVMELEKVINPSLQQGQNSSIKPAHKDSHIFNYCFRSAEQSLRKLPCCLPKRRTQGPQIPAALIIYSCSSYSVALTHSPSCWWICSVYLYDKHCEEARPLEKGFVSQGLNERLASRHQNKSAVKTQHGLTFTDWNWIW